MTWAHVQELMDEKNNPPKMPYRTMLGLLKAKLEKTTNKREREQIETDMVIITGIVEAQTKLDGIIKTLEKRIL